MCFKLSKKQIIILVVVSLIGGILGYLHASFFSGVQCLIKGEQTICPSDPRLILMFFSFLVFGVLTYLIEVIYNYLRK